MSGFLGPGVPSIDLATQVTGLLPLVNLTTGAANQVLRVPAAGGGPLWGAVDLAATNAVTGILPYARGGTGVGSYTANRLPKAGAAAFANSLLSDNATNVTLTSGQLLLPDGTAAAPSLAMSSALTEGFYRQAVGEWEFVGANLSLRTSILRMGSGQIVNLRQSSIGNGLLQIGDGGTGIGIVRSDTILVGEAANTLAQRNGVNGQTLRVYETFTDTANYSRLSVNSVGNVRAISSDSAGTGVRRDISFAFDLNGFWRIRSAAQDFVPEITNLVNFGAANNRPLQVFVGTSGIDSTGIIEVTADLAQPFRLAKSTVAITAPGAGKGTLRWETGTDAGTLKLVGYTGTSTTGVTVVDNVGAGN